MAVSGLVIHSVPEHWPNPITDLIEGFKPQLSTGQVSLWSTLSLLLQVRPLTLLLELLTIIPEEFSTLLLSSQRRATVSIYNFHFSDISP